MKNFKNMNFKKCERNQSLLLLPKKCSLAKKTEYFYKNKTLQLINDFYANLFSLRNLEKKYWINVLIFLIFIVLSILDFYKKSLELIDLSIYSIMIYFITMVSYFSILKYNEMSIVNNHNKRYCCTFTTIYEARNDWLTRQLGEDYATFETLKKFEDWKKYRDNYPIIYKFDWKKYTYQADAKPRIIGLTIALLSILVTVLIRSSDSNNLENTSEQLILVFKLVGMITPYIIILFYMIIFLFNILRLTVNSFFDIIFKDKFSETKYKTFMAFIVNQLEIGNGA